VLPIAPHRLVLYSAVALAVLLIGWRSSHGSAPATAYDQPAASTTAPPAVQVVVVDVTGAVRRPGVYRMPAGSRVDDAVTRAGGPTGEAELEAVNLAARLADGQQVVVPERLAAGAAPAGAPAEDGPISLGTATVEQLEEIDGIGPVTAGDIVEFRDQHGGLSSVDQLDQVPGIGPATMSALRERLQP
jgi:competence protein ComEA